MEIYSRTEHRTKHPDASRTIGNGKKRTQNDEIRIFAESERNARSINLQASLDIGNGTCERNTNFPITIRSTRDRPNARRLAQIKPIALYHAHRATIIIPILRIVIVDVSVPIIRIEIHNANIRRPF